MRSAWQAAQTFNRPLYTNFVVNSDSVRDLGLFSRSNGLIHKVFENKTAAQNADIQYSWPQIRNLDQDNLVNDYIPSSIMSYLSLNRAYYSLEHGKINVTENYLAKSRDLNQRVFIPRLNEFLIHKNEWLENKQNVDETNK